MLSERPCGDVRRLYRGVLCIYASWRKVPDDGDAGYGCETASTDGRLRHGDDDELWIRSLPFYLEPIPRGHLCSDGIRGEDRGSGRRLHEDSFYIPGILPQDDRGSAQMEPAFCSASRRLQCPAWIRASVNRRQGQHVWNIRGYRRSSDPGIICSGCGCGKGYHYAGTEAGRK